MNHYTPYPAYKKSKVEWLGQVPEHWTVKRLRYNVTLNPPVKSGLSPDAEVSFLPMEAIGVDGSINLERSRLVADVCNGYSYFENGDLAFAKVTPCFENGKGAIMHGLAGGIGFGTTELTVLRPKKETDLNFASYVLQSDRFRSLGTGAMTGAGGLKRVPDEFTRNFKSPWPEIHEQEMIAKHLDCETMRINDLIYKKARFIDLLREKRQALITHAVTKGLDPEVKTKDSGIEWLGSMPAHWSTTRIKYIITSISQGWSPECEGRPVDDDEWGVLKVGCVNGGIFRPMENKALPSTLTPRPELKLTKGDVLVSRANTRELVGGCVVIDDDFPKLMLCDKLYRLIVNKSMVTSGFLATLISIHGRREVEIEANGASSSMVNIAQSVIQNLQTSLPPIKEQILIYEYLGRKAAGIDKLINKTERSIELLKERRSALITAAVTGQIDVREAA